MLILVGGQIKTSYRQPRRDRGRWVDQFLAVGWVEAKSGFEVVRPKVNEPILFACYDGEGEVWCNSRWQRCPTGTAYLAPIGKPCAYRAVAGKVWNCCWIVGMDDSIISVPEPTLVLAEPVRLLSAIQGLHEENLLAGDLSVIQHWVELIVTFSWRIAHPQMPHYSRLRALWSLALADLAYDWSVAALAARAGFSDETLRRLCQAETKRSPMEYLTYLRMRYAASLLVSSPLSVEQVAARVGYKNAFAFSAAFRRVIGVPPSHYRRNGEQG